MRVDSYNNQQNFTSIYRIKNANPKIIKEVSDNFAPLYAKISKEPCFIFSGEHPFEPAVVESLQDHANMLNCSMNWLTQNITKHGRIAPNPEDTSLWVFTGLEDFRLITTFSDKMHNTKTKFVDRFKTLFMPSKKPELPEHLKDLEYVLDKNEEYIQGFADICKDKKIIYVKDTQTLILRYLHDEA